MATETKALERRQQNAAAIDLVAAGPIKDLASLREKMDKLSLIANVLMPMNLGAIPQKQAVAPQVIVLDVETTNDDYGGASGIDVYISKQFCNRDPKNPDNDDVALTQSGILKIIGAAGFSVVASDRIDDRSDPLYVAWRVILRGRTVSGEYIQSVGTKEIDLRDGSPEATAMTTRQLPKARQMMMAMAESKAMLRAARRIPGMPLPQKMKRSQAAKPWIVPRLVPWLDMSDPDDAKAARDAALGTQGRLYGGATDAPQLAGPVPSVELVAPPPLGTARDTGDHDDAVDAEFTGGDGRGVVGNGEAPRRPAGSIPAPSTKPKKPAPEAMDDASAFDMAPEAPTAPPVEDEAIIVCLCPCACQREVTEEVAAKTTEKLGTVRCSLCFPGARFDLRTHESVVDFKLPKWPNVTYAQIKARVEAARAK